MEENKLLLKEREYYYDQNIKTLAKDNEQLRNENKRMQAEVQQKISFLNEENGKLQKINK